MCQVPSTMINRVTVLQGVRRVSMVGADKQGNLEEVVMEEDFGGVISRRQMLRTVGLCAAGMGAAQVEIVAAVPERHRS